MKPFPHDYSVRLAGGPAGSATVSVDGAPVLTSAPPPEFEGPSDAWRPEHLLLAAVETCVLARTARACLVSASLATPVRLESGIDWA